MRAWLKGVIVAGLLLGAGLTLLGVLARWWPALDMVNNGLLFMTVGAIALLCLALAARDWRLRSRRDQCHAGHRRAAGRCRRRRAG